MDTHQRVLALPARPPHLPGRGAGLLALLLASRLLLLLSFLWAQTACEPELTQEISSLRPCGLALASCGPPA
jgi:hypothetical protein